MLKTFGQEIKKEPCYRRANLSVQGNLGDDYKYDYDSVPETMMWNNVNGTNYLTAIKNQHLP